ncbi:hypothetical protein pb186bvf_015350 [Paramecium bursaria]
MNKTQNEIKTQTICQNNSQQMIFYFILILNYVIGQQTLNWVIYNLDGSPSLNNMIYVGYLGKELRLYPQGSAVFQSTFCLCLNLAAYPQQPCSLLNQPYLSMKVGSSIAGSILLNGTQYSSSLYSQPSGLALIAISQQCQINPTSDFSTIMVGSKVTVTLNFLNCLPITTQNIQALYNNLAKTISVQQSQPVVYFDVTAGSATVGSTIQVTFSSNAYYSIQSLSFTVVAVNSATPIAQILNNQLTCQNQFNIQLNCSKASVLYFSYFYISTPSQSQVITNARLNYQSQYMEGYGLFQVLDNTLQNLQITNLRSNTQYTILVFCQDQMYTLSTNQYIQMSKCDKNLYLTYYKFFTKQVLFPSHIQLVICDFMVKYQLSQNQISSDNVQFCDDLAQKYYQQSLALTVKETLTIPLSHSIIIYPNYQSDTQVAPSTLIIDRFIAYNTTIQTIQPQVPQVQQETIRINGQYLNFTLQLSSQAYVYMGLDAINIQTPNFKQLKQGLNGNNVLLVKFQATNVTQYYQTQFLISTNTNYQFYYLIATDPSLNAYFGQTYVRPFNVSEKYSLMIFIIIYILQ